MGSSPGCVHVRWEGREKTASQKRERKRQTGGLWRNIKEGGIEEECVGRERKKEEAGIGIHFFFFYTHGI